MPINEFEWRTDLATSSTWRDCLQTNGVRSYLSEVELTVTQPTQMAFSDLALAPSLVEADWWEFQEDLLEDFELAAQV